MSRMIRTRSAGQRTRSRGFSLIELLLAIFILGLGLISIAALFPAGIVLQQRAEDDFYGPVVAEHAMGVLRSRLDADDFGTWWDFMRLQGDVLADAGGDAQALLTQARADLGQDSAVQLAAWLRLTDWPWLRPSVIAVPPAGQGELLGAIDIFNAAGWNASGVTVGEHTGDQEHPWGRFLAFNPLDFIQTGRGLPFDPSSNVVNGAVQPPSVIISAADRSWPTAGTAGARPRYYWDCAFRKIGDRVQAAVFVYRASASTLSAPPFRPGVITQDAQGFDVPAIPHRLVLELFGSLRQWQPGDGTADAPLPIFSTSIDVNDVDHVWMHSGQWALDQMGTVHRVISGRDRNGSANDVVLSTAVPGPVVSAMLDRNDVDGDGDTSDVALFTASTALPPRTYFSMEREDYRSGVLRHKQFLHQFKKSVDHLFYMPSELPGPGGVTYFIEPVYIGVEDL